MNHIPIGAGPLVEDGQPDTDTIKMFVGQIPKHMHEPDLKRIFEEEFGPVQSINVHRDKVTKEHKGCCFVTFYKRQHALLAVDRLHNKRTLSGMPHPIQMKPADSESRNVEERKVFVGMLGKKLDEGDLKTMFAPYGKIEDSTILRNPDNTSCAFITYAKRAMCLEAIRKLHHSQTMEGSSAPLVVKFADTTKEKEAKKMQQQMHQLTPSYLMLLHHAAMNSSNGNPAQTLSTLSHLASLYPNLSMPNLAAMAAAGSNQQQTHSPMNNMQALNIQGLSSMASASKQSHHQGGGTGLGGCLLGVSDSEGMTGYNEHSTSLAMDGFHQHPCGSGSNMGLGNLQGMGASGMTGGLNGFGNDRAMPSNSPSGLMDSFSQNFSSMQSIQQHSYPPFSQSMGPPPGSGGMISKNKDAPQQYGPDGANLFIYHLPQEFTDQDLYHAFQPYGMLKSAKVFVDKNTGLSKCFGFVSYETPGDANEAIMHMNGFQIGNKRLKVQLKRPRNQ